jgi:hypothetical protein
VAETCVYGNEPRGSKSGGEFLDELSDCKVIKQTSAPWSLLLHALGPSPWTMVSFVAGLPPSYTCSYTLCIHALLVAFFNYIDVGEPRCTERTLWSLYWFNYKHNVKYKE